MKFGSRMPTITKRIAARTSIKRIVQNKLGLQVPPGYRGITNPKKIVSNKVYNKTSVRCMFALVVFIGVSLGLLLILM
jgi:hypothetical protein